MELTSQQTVFRPKQVQDKLVPSSFVQISGFRARSPKTPRALQYEQGLSRATPSCRTYTAHPPARRRHATPATRAKSETRPKLPMDTDPATNPEVESPPSLRPPRKSRARVSPRSKPFLTRAL